MKIVVCGAGHVGLSIAQYFSEEYDVTLIDHAPEVLAHVSETMDIQTVLGNAADYNVLREAGAMHAGIFLAVTGVDEVNLVACQIAHSAFHINRKIARVRDAFQFNTGEMAFFRANYLPVDIMISPEEDVAVAITQTLQLPQAFEVLNFSHPDYYVVGLRPLFKSVVLYTPIRHLEVLFPGIPIKVLLIKRHRESFIPKDEDQLFPHDDVYLLMPKRDNARILEAFGYNDHQAQKLVILGGGRVGSHLAQYIETHYPHVSCTLVENQKKQSQQLVSKLSRTFVLLGDALETHIFQEASIRTADIVVSVTNDDKVNVLAALLAKNNGAKRVLALVGRRGVDYKPLVGPLGIDKIINPPDLTISSIVRHVRKAKIHMAYSFGENFSTGEIIEVEVLPSSYSAAFLLDDINSFPDMRIFALIRDREIFFELGGLTLQSHDRLLLIVMREGLKRFKKFFEARN